MRAGVDARYWRMTACCHPCEVRPLEIDMAPLPKFFKKGKLIAFCTKNVGLLRSIFAPNPNSELPESSDPFHPLNSTIIQRRSKMNLKSDLGPTDLGLIEFFSFSLMFLKEEISMKKADISTQLVSDECRDSVGRNDLFVIVFMNNKALSPDVSYHLIRRL
jgi:hypothetical protein